MSQQVNPMSQGVNQMGPNVGQMSQGVSQSGQMGQGMGQMAQGMGQMGQPMGQMSQMGQGGGMGAMGNQGGNMGPQGGNAMGGFPAQQSFQQVRIYVLAFDWYYIVMTNQKTCNDIPSNMAFFFTFDDLFIFMRCAMLSDLNVHKSILYSI